MSRRHRLTVRCGDESLIKLIRFFATDIDIMIKTHESIDIRYLGKNRDGEPRYSVDLTKDQVDYATRKMNRISLEDYLGVEVL